MASSQDIRAWAAAEGIQLKPKGPPTKAARVAYAAAHGDVDTVAGGDVVDAEEGYGGWSEQDSDQQPTTDPERPTLTAGEKPPAPGRPTWRERLKRRGGKAKKPVTRGRASTEKLIELGWSQIARVFDNQQTWATANVLRMQAPVAGSILDAELRGTAADALMQPLARMVNRSSAVGSLIALPIMVQIVSMRPQLYQRMEPLMVEAVYSYLEIAGPAVEKRRKAHAKRAEQYGQDAQELLRAIFTPPAAQGEPVGDVDAAAA